MGCICKNFPVQRRWRSGRILGKWEWEAWGLAQTNWRHLSSSSDLSYFPSSPGPLSLEQQLVGSVL